MPFAVWSLDGLFLKTDRNVLISKIQWIELERQAIKHYPEEACALLVGKQGEDGSYQINEVVIARNIAENRHHFFEIDPSTRIKTEKRVRGGLEKVIGVFHSHPNGLDEPSKADAEMVIERDLVWLIAAVGEDLNVTIRAFMPKNETGFDELVLRELT